MSAAEAGPRPRVDDEEVRDRRVGDEGLGAVQQPPVASRHRGRRERERTGSRLRLGDPGRADDAAVGQARAATRVSGPRCRTRTAGPRTRPHGRPPRTPARCRARRTRSPRTPRRPTAGPDRRRSTPREPGAPCSPKSAQACHASREKAPSRSRRATPSANREAANSTAPRRRRRWSAVHSKSTHPPLGLSRPAHRLRRGRRILRHVT